MDSASPSNFACSSSKLTLSCEQRSKSTSSFESISSSGKRLSSIISFGPSMPRNWLIKSSFLCASSSLSSSRSGSLICRSSRCDSSKRFTFIAGLAIVEAAEGALLNALSLANNSSLPPSPKLALFSLASRSISSG